MVESYQHQAAKAVLAGWLREMAAEADAKGWDSVSAPTWPRWRINRGPPFWGVWTEYPVDSEDRLTSQVWDEDDETVPNRAAEIPTYDEMIAAGVRPQVIFDLAIQHKGSIIYGLEVVHKHDITPEKFERMRRLLNNTACEVYTVPAHWILSQVRRPIRFVSTCIF